MADACADVLIVGGGVAGLWARSELRRRGWSVVLCEACALGAGQTGASQGILHGGVKYHLSAAARGASRALAEAREAWRNALEGGGPDLSRVGVLSRCTHLWTLGWAGRAAGEAASLAMRSDVRRLGAAELPEAFRGAPASLAVWEASEACIDAGSLVHQLALAVDGPLIRAACRAVVERSGRIEARLETPDGGELRIDAGAAVLAAGAGNQPLLGDPGVMQRRPLHMVLLRNAPGMLFGHALRAGSDRPRLTVTSARSGDEIVWYLGGDLAETGVARDRGEQIIAAREELASVFGWADVSRSRFATLRIDRAEGCTPGGARPDSAVVRRRSRVVAVWPTKLALAPLAASMVASELEGLGLEPGGELICPALTAPGVAIPPWEWGALTWT